MLEYIFFDPDLLDRFVTHAQQLGVACIISDDSMGFMVQVSEDLPESDAALLEKFYDQLLEEQSTLVESVDGGLVKHAAGIRVTLSSGRPCMIRLQPEMANRLLACFNLDEVQELVNAVAISVECQDDGPLCHTPGPSQG